MARIGFKILVLLSIGVLVGTLLIWERGYLEQQVWPVWVGADSATFIVCCQGRLQWVGQAVVCTDRGFNGRVDVSEYDVLILRPRGFSEYGIREHALGLPLTSAPASGPPLLSAKHYMVCSVRSEPHDAFRSLSYWYANPELEDPSDLTVQVTTRSVPCWAIALTAGVLPAARLRQRLAETRRRRRIAQGRCANCNYDLRASRERCPECGMAIHGR